ncbi:hypothetical protein D4R99_04140 [bacterium]|nr:MAG: hypothetical protein D4R99_04140 [bacterium]
MSYKTANTDKQIRIIDFSVLIRSILLISFSVFITFLSTYKIYLDDDVFWHLTTGRYIINTGSIPSSDVFGFITSGAPWMPFEWGWDVLTYLIFKSGGFTALSVFRTLIVLCVFWIIYIMARKFDVKDGLIIFVFLISVFGTLTRYSVRPQLISYLLTVITLYLLVHYIYFNSVKHLYFLPVVFLLWANMHMGIALGLIIVGLTLIYQIIKCARKKEKIIVPVSVLLLCIAALSINPHFIYTYIYAYGHTKMELLASINEWKSPFETERSFIGYVFFFFLSGGIAVAFYSYKKKEILPVIIFCATAYYAVQSNRFTADFIFANILFIIVSFNYIVNLLKLNSGKINPSIKRLPSLIMVFIFVSLTVLCSSDKLYRDYLNMNFRETGFGINGNFFPEKMFEFISAAQIDKIGSKPFNNLRIGGYFIWNFPNSRNFIDSRNLNDSIYNLYKIIDLKKPGFEKKISDYEIDYVIYSVPYMTRNAIEIQNNLISFLSLSQDWKLIYWDDISFLFVRNNDKFKDIISRNEYKYVNPFKFIFSKNVFFNSFNSDMSVFKSELSRKRMEEPNGKIINEMLKKLKL